MAKDHSETAAQKLEYQTPLLTRYGALRDLTQAGTGIKTENVTNCTKGVASTIRQRSC